MVGYCGGSTADPTYKSIGDHTEALRVTFDSRVVTAESMLERLVEMHDPMPRAFTGTQYRSAIFYHNDAQAETAAAVAGRQASSQAKHTSIEPAGPFYRAEEYHQRFLAKQTGRWAASPSR